jgi:hypothetical protein
VFRSVVLAAALAVSTGAVAGDSVQWAYPGLGRPSGHGAAASGTVTVPGSTQQYPASQVDDFFIGVDWFPQRHAAMPLVVAHGRRPNVYACAYCHLPQGEGRPETPPSPDSPLHTSPINCAISAMANARPSTRATSRPGA